MRFRTWRRRGPTLIEVERFGNETGRISSPYVVCPPSQLQIPSWKRIDQFPIVQHQPPTLQETNKDNPPCQWRKFLCSVLRSLDQSRFSGSVFKLGTSGSLEMRLALSFSPGTGSSPSFYLSISPERAREHSAFVLNEPFLTVCLYPVR